MPIPQLKPKQRFDKSWRQDVRQRKIKKRKQWFEHLTNRWLPILAIMVIGGGISLLAIFAWFSRDLPNPDKLIDRSIAESTKIYARDEKTILYEVHGEEKRTMVNLDEISDHAINAHIALEDKNFYEHKGFSLLRIFKSIYIDIIQRRKAQGASTITQQFVKNAILTTEKSWTRKIKELVLAYQIERKFSKEEILKMYFNEIPYGSSYYGIEAAAQSYFGKNAKDLAIDEGALLAAMTQATTYYSPYGANTDKLVARQQLTIKLMADQGYITPEEAESALEIDTLAKVRPRRENMLAPHFVMYVREILAEKYGEKEIEQGGLKVVTTLDYEKQKIAEEEINKGIEKINRYNGSNAALIALDVKTGEILAMVGSKDYFDETIDGNVNVTTRPRQPGSSFKPIVYAKAFDTGYTPETILFDLVTTFKTETKDYVPKNYDLTEHGPVTMRQALQASLNIPAVKTLYLTGVEKVLDLAENMGYSTFSDRGRFGLSLVLGGGEVKLLEHVSAYSVFANEGERVAPASILRIEDNKGKVLEKKSDPSPARVLDQEIARQMNKVLSDNSTRASFWGYTLLSLGGRPVAAKTGTTNDYRDAWTLGYTPSLAVGVWAGNNDNSEMARGAAGLVLAAPIWNGFMTRALEGAPVEYFKDFKAPNTDKPVLNGKLEGEMPIKVDTVTGKQIPSSCLADWPEEFIEEKTVRAVHNILHYVIKDDPQGDYPLNPESDSQYENWEAPVRSWAEKNSYLTESPALESCDLRATENLPQISFVSPANNDTLTNPAVTFKVETEGTYDPQKVEYLIDDVSVGLSAKTPFSYTHNLSGLSKGYHDLTAIVTDEFGNTGQTKITININLTQTTSSLYFISPNQNASYLLSDFPLIVRVFAYDPEGIESVTLSRQDSEGEEAVVSKKNAPASPTLDFNWEEDEEGTYKLFITVTNKKDEQTSSDYLTVKISP